MHHAERIFHGDELVAAGLAIAFGTAQRRQNQAFVARYQMAAVQLGTDVYRQTTVLQRFFGNR